MDGKQKCNVLKRVRKQMADKLGIDLHQKECTFEGECSGTCPKCAHEESILNAALLKKGAAAVTAVALTAALAGCTPFEEQGNIQPQDPSGVEDDSGGGYDELSGDVVVPDYDGRPFFDDVMGLMRPPRNEEGHSWFIKEGSEQQ